MSNTSPESQAQPDPYIALVLQGGGALGAYHIGAYQAMHEAGYTPHWVAGISIGAVNGVLIAGSEPDERINKMDEFWHTISRPSLVEQVLPANLLKFYNMGSAVQGLMLGQPNFSTPHFISPYLAPAGTAAAVSFYDSTPLHKTLAHMVNFDLINQQRVRLSLGVTRVRTGDMVFFDNYNPEDLPMGPEHAIASSSIPPLFPGVRIKGELYWDGGIIDNTPLEPVLDDQDLHPERRMLVFMIDLWDGSGPEPRTIDEVLWRQDQIRFASRTTRHIKELVARENMRQQIREMQQQSDTADRGVAPVFDDGTAFRYGNVDIVRITYQPRADQSGMSYMDFSRSSIADRRADGYGDMKLALEDAPWHRRTAAGAEEGKPRQARAAIHHVSRTQKSSETPGYQQP